MQLMLECCLVSRGQGNWTGRPPSRASGPAHSQQGSPVSDSMQHTAAQAEPPDRAAGPAGHYLLSLQATEPGPRAGGGTLHTQLALMNFSQKAGTLLWGGPLQVRRVLAVPV